jgi:type IV secretory pathway TrbF-like protein
MEKPVDPNHDIMLEQAAAALTEWLKYNEPFPEKKKAAMEELRDVKTWPM